jgi:hypothetical protein
MKDKVMALQKAKVPLIPIAVGWDGAQALLMNEKKNLDDPSLPNGWTNFYRSDDVSATAYFYLDKPVSNLPVLPGVAMRVYNLKSK